MKYVPVLRYRDSEKKTLDDVFTSDKILPLVEIVQEKRRSNMNSTCFEEIKAYSVSKQLLVDFPLYVKFRSKTLEGVRKFIGPLIADPKRRLNEFDKLIGANIIPVASYNPNTNIFLTGNVTNELTHLRSSFDKIGLRIFINHAQQALSEANGLLKTNDIILVDIDETQPNDSTLNSLFSTVSTFAKKHGCRTVLIRTVIGPKQTYTKLNNNSIVQNLDNSLLNNYLIYGFHAFGDYCGIKKDELTSGGKSSPGCIFYHWWSNAYYGHKGVFEQPKTFTSMVVQSLTSSQQWVDYQTNSTIHKVSCPGCKGISKIAATGQGGNSAPKWKIMISSHYLQTMEEFL